MKTKRFSPIIAAFTILILIQVACATSSITDKAGKIVEVVMQTDEVPVESAAQPTSGTGTAPSNAVTQPAPAQKPAITIAAGPPTATPFVYSGSPPQTGTGGVYGRLFWNGKPIEGQEIKLCDEIKMFGGCQGAQFPAVTDAYGVYVILNVTPGTYGLTYRALDSDSWYYVTSGILNAKDFEVPANQMVNVGDYKTIRTDLVILTPQDKERMSNVRRPVLSWEPYPEASYYELTFHMDRGGSLIHRKKLSETTFTMDRDLQSCEYSFDVEAFNAQGESIAEYDGWRRFQIAGFPQNCVMKALSPADGASTAANAITLTWESHEWAAVYKLHMYLKSDSNTKILDFVETTTPNYKVTQAVPAGQYYWVVYAYDAFGDGLGFTNGFILNVTNP